MTAQSSDQSPLPPDHAPSAAPADPPRPLTATARRSASAEPRVRFWIYAALVLTVIAVWFSVDRIREWSRLAALIRNGRLVTARVQTLDSLGRATPASDPVKLTFTLNGTPQLVEGVMEGRSGFVQNNTEVQVRVDPNNPGRWTTLQSVPILPAQLLAAFIIFPVALLLLLLALFLRRRILRIWRNGQAIPALVVETRQSAMSPRSRAIVCTPRDGRDKRLFTVFVPTRIAQFHEGDVIHLLALPHHPDKVIAAILFE